jgi:hypothetical protein
MCSVVADSIIVTPEPSRFRGVFACQEVTVRITRWDGLIDVEQAAELCGVKPVTIRAWTQRGYGPKTARRKLPVAKRENGLILLDPIEVAKADHATKERARREVIREGFPVAA